MKTAISIKHRWKYSLTRLGIEPGLSCPTVLPAKSDSDFMFCLQSYQGPLIDRSLVY